MNRSPNDFDALAMYAAMDARRTEHGLSWCGVARAIWEQSALLNQHRRDHPISPAYAALPAAGPDRRLRWDLGAVFESLNQHRQQRDLTWREAAMELRCTDNQLTGIRTARYAIGMKLMMRIVRWLDVPSSTFIYRARW